VACLCIWCQLGLSIGSLPSLPLYFHFQFPSLPFLFPFPPVLCSPLSSYSSYPFPSMTLHFPPLVENPARVSGGALKDLPAGLIGLLLNGFWCIVTHKLHFWSRMRHNFCSLVIEVYSASACKCYDINQTYWLLSYSIPNEIENAHSTQTRDRTKQHTVQKENQWTFRLDLDKNILPILLASCLLFITVQNLVHMSNSDRDIVVQPNCRWPTSQTWIHVKLQLWSRNHLFNIVLHLFCSHPSIDG